MRTSKYKLNPSLKKEIIRSLCQVVVDINSVTEAKSFLTDFLTPGELEIFSKRLAVGYWLKKQRSYTNIRKNLSVSSATIAEIHRLSQNEGFKLAIKKMEAEEWANKWAQKIQSIKSKIV